jgi:imidazolonepropionase-like amidohydrolase
MRILPLLCASLLALPLGAQPGSIAIRNARVVDGTGAPAVVETVVIQGNRIVAVGPTAAIPPGSRTINAQGKTLIPGVFDLHTHLRTSGAGLTADWGKTLAAYLACGVTSVNDYNEFGEMFEPMRRLVGSGAVAGPRLHLAIRMSPPGGHGAESGFGDMFTLEASTPAQAHFLMKGALQYQPDLIKIFTDGWRYGTSPSLPSMNEETIAAIVQDAHRAGVKVVTHTLTLENARLTVRAGVDSLVHGIQDKDVDEDFIRLIKKTGAGYVSTLAVYEPRDRSRIPEEARRVIEPAILNLNAPAASRATAESAASPAAAESREARWKHLLHNDRALFDAGVTLGNGTDAGMFVGHGWATLHELELKTQAGFTPLEAITIATSNSARILGVDRDLGSIQPGKLADLVLIDGKPDQDIRDIYKTAEVFKDGKEYRPEILEKEIGSEGMSPLPSHPVGALVDDFEREDGRTELGTLRTPGTDAGSDHSKILFVRMPRGANDHSLMVQVSMGPKENNFALLHIPLTPGGIELADIGKYKGVSFDVRGEGRYRLKLVTAAVRSGEDFNAPFEAGREWKTQRIDFDSLTRTGGAPLKWQGRDVRELTFEISGPAGASRWLDLDNIRFY